jgi:hypothetical protein
LLAAACCWLHLRASTFAFGYATQRQKARLKAKVKRFLGFVFTRVFRPDFLT